MLSQFEDDLIRRNILVFTFVILCAISQLFNTATEASGQVMLSIENVQLATTDDVQTQAFDIVLTHDLPGPLEVTGYQAALSLFALNGGSPSATITDVTGPLEQPYIFAPNTTAPTSLISNNGENVQFGDFLLTGFGLAESGSVLASVEFEIGGGVQDGDRYGLAFDTDPNETFVAGADSNLLNLTTVDGEAFAIAIPEPSSMSFFVLLFVALLSTTRRRNIEFSLD